MYALLMRLIFFISLPVANVAGQNTAQNRHNSQEYYPDERRPGAHWLRLIAAIVMIRGISLSSPRALLFLLRRRTATVLATVQLSRASATNYLH